MCEKIFKRIFLKKSEYLKENLFLKRFIFVFLFQEMLPLLKKAAARNSKIGGLNTARAAVLNISSLAGSITKISVETTTRLLFPGYKISKVSI